jgi:hypothetical protein
MISHEWDSNTTSKSKTLRGWFELFEHSKYNRLYCLLIFAHAMASFPCFPVLACHAGGHEGYTCTNVFLFDLEASRKPLFYNSTMLCIKHEEITARKRGHWGKSAINTTVYLGIFGKSKKFQKSKFFSEILKNDNMSPVRTRTCRVRVGGTVYVPLCDLSSIGW